VPGNHEYYKSSPTEVGPNLAKLTTALPEVVIPENETPRGRVGDGTHAHGDALRGPSDFTRLGFYRPRAKERDRRMSLVFSATYPVRGADPWDAPESTDRHSGRGPAFRSEAGVSGVSVLVHPAERLDLLGRASRRPRVAERARTFPGAPTAARWPGPGPAPKPARHPLLYCPEQPAHARERLDRRPLRPIARTVR
jgi:hypothetical protein